jgi:broad specificity phosphatase PhoE
VAAAIFLARHGETDWNAGGRWQGHSDPPLNDRGREQARALADELRSAGVDTIWTSDLVRARETATIVASCLGLAPVRVSRELREVDVGEWSGLTSREVASRYPDAFARWQAYERGWQEGETYEQMAERVVAAVHEIVARHDERRILIVSHGGPIRALQAAALGIGYAQHRRAASALGNCAVCRLLFEDGSIRPID